MACFAFAGLDLEQQKAMERVGRRQWASLAEAEPGNVTPEHVRIAATELI